MPAATGADSAEKSFARAWQGQRVVVKQALFALVYNERSKLGNTRHSKRDGLVVLTPFNGSYLQFDGRDSEEDITSRDVNQIVHTVSEQYRRGSQLDMGNYQKIEPLYVARYEKGAELIVTGVSVERDRVRFLFSEPAGGRDPGDLATTLTVKWPVPLSKSLSEREMIEKLVKQVIAVRR